MAEYCSFVMYFEVEGKFRSDNLNRMVEKGTIRRCPEIDEGYLRKALEWIGVVVPGV